MLLKKQFKSLRSTALIGIQNCLFTGLPLVKIQQNQLEVEKRELEMKEAKLGTLEIQDLIFSLPGYENFPDRAKSIFCNTQKNNDFAGSRYYIYPFNGTKMAITEADDFNFTKVLVGTKYESEIIDLDHTIKRLLMRYGNSSRSKEFEKSYKALLSIDKQLPTWEEFKAELSPSKLGLKVETVLNKKEFERQHEVWFEGKYLSIPAESFSEFKNLLVGDQ